MENKKKESFTLSAAFNRCSKFFFVLFILMLVIEFTTVMYYKSIRFTNSHKSGKTSELTNEVQNSDTTYFTQQSDVLKSYIAAIDELHGLLDKYPKDGSVPDADLLNSTVVSINKLMEISSTSKSLHHVENVINTSKTASNDAQTWQMFNSYISLYATTVSYAIDDYKNNEGSMAIDFIKLSSDSLTNAANNLQFYAQDQDSFVDLGLSLNKLIVITGLFK